jgi:hypothetical protein
MVTTQQVIKGVLEYADKNVMPKLEEGKQFLAGMVLGVVGNKADGMIRALAQQPMIAALDIAKPNGEVDLDTLYAAAVAQIDKQHALPVDVPIIGRLTFSRSDLDELYHVICRQ